MGALEKDCPTNGPQGPQHRLQEVSEGSDLGLRAGPGQAFWETSGGVGKRDSHYET